MSRSPRYLALTAVAAVGLCGCLASQMRSEFAAASGCSDQQVDTQMIDEVLVAVTGCGRQDIYAMYGPNNQYTSAAERAGFELSCERGDVNVRQLSGRIVGAVGCERKVTLIHDPANGWRVESSVPVDN